MKKIAVFILSGALLVACGSSNKNEKSTSTQNTSSNEQTTESAATVKKENVNTELNNIAKVSRFSSLFLEVLAISFHNQSEEGQLLCDRQVIFKESGCSLSVIVPYYPHGNLCER